MDATSRNGAGNHVPVPQCTICVQHQMSRPRPAMKGSVLCSFHEICGPNARLSPAISIVDSRRKTPQKGAAAKSPSEAKEAYAHLDETQRLVVACVVAKLHHKTIDGILRQKGIHEYGSAVSVIESIFSDLGLDTDLSDPELLAQVRRIGKMLNVEPYREAKPTAQLKTRSPRLPGTGRFVYGGILKRPGPPSMRPKTSK